MGAKRNIKILAVFNLFTDLKLYAAVTILYFAKVTGSYALGMSILSVSNISVALFEVPTGIFSDMIGRRRTVMCGAFFAVMYSIMYAIGANYWFLFAGAILQGISVSFYSGNNDALLHDSLRESSQEHRFHDYLGKLSSLFQVALAIGSIFGSILAGWSFSLVMWLSVIPQAVCLALSFFLIEPSIHIEKSTNIYSHLSEAVKLFFTNRKLGLIAFASSYGSALGEAMFQFQAAFYNMLWPLWAIGIAKTMSFIGGFFSFFFSGKIIDRLGAAKSLLVGSVTSRIANLTAVIFPSPVSPLLMSSTSLTYGVTEVSKSTLMQQEFTPHQRATMASLTSFMSSMMFAVFAVAIGWVGDKSTPLTALLLTQILGFFTNFIYWKIFREDRKHAAT